MKKKAFTLIEVLITTVIIATLLLGLMSIVMSGNQIYLQVTDSIEIRQAARNAMDRIVRELRESNGAPSAEELALHPSDITFTGPRLPSVRYFLSNGNIMREYPAGTIQSIAVNVTDLVFVRSGPQVDITIQATQDTGTPPLTFLLKQKVRLRNE